MAILALAALLGGCTPLGLWVYEDPSMVLRSAAQITLAGNPVRGDSLEFVLLGCNLNDYDLTSDSVTTSLSIGGQRVAGGTTVRPLLFATRDTSRFSVTIPVLTEAAAFEAEARPFELVVVSSLKTPLGVRELTYRLSGDVRLIGGTLNWRVPGGRGCRPGASQLPDYFDRRIPLDRRPD